MGDSTDEAERCRVITEVAVEQAMEKCGSEEAVREQLARMVGLEDRSLPGCDSILDGSLDESTLESSRQVREWVFCRAWEAVEEDGKTLSTAIAKSWAEVRAAGDELDVEV